MWKKKYNMMDCIAFGKKGEDSVLNYMLTQKGFLGVIDARNVEDTRESDIDFLFLTGDGNWHSVEVKTDSYKSGNIFVEEIADKEKGAAGYLFSTKAEYIFYYLINSSVLFIIRAVPFVDWYKKNYERFRYIGSIKNETAGWSSYSSSGRLVPGRILEKECKGCVTKVSNVYVCG